MGTSVGRQLRLRSQKRRVCAAASRRCRTRVGHELQLIGEQLALEGAGIDGGLEVALHPAQLLVVAVHTGEHLGAAGDGRAAAGLQQAAHGGAAGGRHAVHLDPIDGLASDGRHDGGHTRGLVLIEVLNCQLRRTRRGCGERRWGGGGEWPAAPAM